MRKSCGGKLKRNREDEILVWRFRFVAKSGGTSCLVMGLVFKTSGLSARAGAGGFDSHVPPPSKGSESVDVKAGRG